MLDDLISGEHLLLSAMAGNINMAFDRIIPRTNRGSIQPSLLIGIDGSVTSGKSFTANALEEYLSQNGMNSTLVHGDWFMSSRDQRKLEIEKASHESYSIASYDTAACDFGKLEMLQQQIWNFLRSERGNEDIVISDTYNRITGECDQDIKLRLFKKSAIVFEGTGILRSAMHKMFNLSIRVDISSYQETIKRLIERESEKAPSQRLQPDFLKKRYELIDYPYDRYLRFRDKKNFDVLIDTSDTTSINIYTRN